MTTTTTLTRYEVHVRPAGCLPTTVRVGATDANEAADVAVEWLRTHEGYHLPVEAFRCRVYAMGGRDG